MVSPLSPSYLVNSSWRDRSRGKFREIYKTARTKQRRLNRYLCNPHSAEWDD